MVSLKSLIPLRWTIVSPWHGTRRHVLFLTITRVNRDSVEYMVNVHCADAMHGVHFQL